MYRDDVYFDEKEQEKLVDALDKVLEYSDLYDGWVYTCEPSEDFINYADWIEECIESRDPFEDFTTTMDEIMDNSSYEYQTAFGEVVDSLDLPESFKKKYQDEIDNFIADNVRFQPDYDYYYDCNYSFLILLKDNRGNTKESSLWDLQDHNDPQTIFNISPLLEKFLKLQRYTKREFLSYCSSSGKNNKFFNDLIEKLEDNPEFISFEVTTEIGKMLQALTNDDTITLKGDDFKSFKGKLGKDFEVHSLRYNYKNNLPDESEVLYDFCEVSY